jgi:hypothetical protein
MVLALLIDAARAAGAARVTAIVPYLRINADNGRDHWGQAMSMVLAGAGLRGGEVLGRTDRQAAEVTAEACTPEDVAATALFALGIDHHKEYQTSSGRPIHIVRDGRVLRRLF